MAIPVILKRFLKYCSREDGFVIPWGMLLATAGIGAVSGLSKAQQEKKQQRAEMEKILVEQRLREAELKRQWERNDQMRRYISQKYGFTYTPLPGIPSAPKLPKTGLTGSDIFTGLLGGAAGGVLGAVPYMFSPLGKGGLGQSGMDLTGSQQIGAWQPKT